MYPTWNWLACLSIKFKLFIRFLNSFVQFENFLQCFHYIFYYWNIIIDVHSDTGNTSSFRLLSSLIIILNGYIPPKRNIHSNIHEVEKWAEWIKISTIRYTKLWDFQTWIKNKVHVFMMAQHEHKLFIFFFIHWVIKIFVQY